MPKNGRRRVFAAFLTVFSSFSSPIAAEAPADPRIGDPGYERAQRLFETLHEILDNAAQKRLERQTDPDSPIADFMWRQLGVDQNSRIRELLANAFEMITDAPVVQLQNEIDAARGEIATMKDQIAHLREKSISAPVDDGWSSWLGLTDDKHSIADSIAALERRIEAQKQGIEERKTAFAEAMEGAGAPLSKEQVDLLLDSVTGDDLVALAAAYEAVRGVSEQLRVLMDHNGEDLAFAKRYYGMHTALIALLVEAHTQFLLQIDTAYLPKLEVIEDDIRAAQKETQRLLRSDPTEEQARALKANAASQQITHDALQLYRSYLTRQRSEIAKARQRTVMALRVADNTLRTVDASFQLKQIMDNAAISFEALQSMESPGFERLFRNEQLRREFQALTDRLGPAS